MKVQDTPVTASADHNEWELVKVQDLYSQSLHLVTTHSLPPAGPLDPMLGQWPVLASETGAVALLQLFCTENFMTVRLAHTSTEPFCVLHFHVVGPLVKYIYALFLSIGKNGMCHELNLALSFSRNYDSLKTHLNKIFIT